MMACTAETISCSSIVPRSLTRAASTAGAWPSSSERATDKDIWRILQARQPARRRSPPHRQFDPRPTASESSSTFQADRKRSGPERWLESSDVTWCHPLPTSPRTMSYGTNTSSSTTSLKWHVPSRNSIGLICSPGDDQVHDQLREARVTVVFERTSPAQHHEVVVEVRPCRPHFVPDTTIHPPRLPRWSALRPDRNRRRAPTCRSRRSTRRPRSSVGIGLAEPPFRTPATTVRSGGQRSSGRPREPRPRAAPPRRRNARRRCTHVRRLAMEWSFPPTPARRASSRTQGNGPRSCPNQDGTEPGGSSRARKSRTSCLSASSSTLVITGTKCVMFHVLRIDRPLRCHSSQPSSKRVRAARPATRSSPPPNWVPRRH